MASGLDPHLFTERDWERETDEKIRLAVAGSGGFARRHALPAIAESEFCDLAVIVSRSGDRARRVAESFGADRGISEAEYHEGVTAGRYDAIYVCTPNMVHLDYARTAAELGKHVICEKPLEGTLERARRLVSVCEDAGVSLMVAYRVQTDPAIRRLRDLLDGGLIGDVHQVHGGFSFRLVSSEADADQWRLDPELAGGGALFDIGVYPLNTTRFLVGEEPMGVKATTSSPTPAFEGLDEHVTFQVSFSGNVTGAFTASYNGHGDDRLQLIGTEGTVMIDSAFGPNAPRSIVIERAEGRTAIEPRNVNDVAEEFDYFANSILEGWEPEPDGRDGLQDMKVLEAVYESAEDAGVRL